MLIALGKIEMNSLIDGMLAMAKDDNSVHEHNQRVGQGNWTHGDGWGIAYLRAGKWVVEKSARPIYDDPKIDRFRNLNTNLVVLHARKKSVGDEINLNNCHPFLTSHKNQEFVFCHNGTIKGKIWHHPTFKPQGTTDSEKLFYSILSQLDNKSTSQAIKEKVDSYSATHGTNVILASMEKTHIYIKENDFPAYYQMKLGKGKNFLLISSEELKNIKHINWELLNSNQVYVINNQNLEVKK